MPPAAFSKREGYIINQKKVQATKVPKAPLVDGSLPLSGLACANLFEKRIVLANVVPRIVIFGREDEQNRVV